MDWNEERVLVTGGVGLIGHRLVKKLVEDGAKVCVLDNLSKTNASSNIKDFPHEVEFREANLLNQDIAIQALKDMTYCFHLCYDDQTEVLTIDGFKRFADVTKNDLIATRTENGYLEYQAPTKLYSYSYSGEMIHFKSKSVDLLVTPNHRVYVKRRTRKDKGWELREARHTLLVSLRMNRQVKWKGKEVEWFNFPSVKQYRNTVKIQSRIKNELFLQFLGYYLSEGSIDIHKRGYRINLSNKDPVLIGKMENVVRAMGYAPYVNTTSTSQGVSFHSKQLYHYLKQFGQVRQKHIPMDIKAYSPRLLRILFDALIAGDGWVRPGKHGYGYKSFSRRLANDVQEIALKLGYAAVITPRYSYEHNSFSKGMGYDVGISQRTTVTLTKRPIKERYDGKVYCLEVPNHVILVRRNGKPIWSGNSAKIGGIGYFHKIPGEILHDNLIMDLNMFEAARQTSTLKKIICMSSSMVFENAVTFPLREKDLSKTPAPKTAYGFSKLATHYIAKAYHDQYSVPYLIIQPFNCFGPGEMSGDYVGYAHVIPDLIKKVLSGQYPLEILGSGKQTRSYTYVDDLVDAMLFLAERFKNDDFNIGTGIETSVMTLAEKIWKLCERKETFAVKHMPMFTFDVQRRVPDISKIVASGWKPRVSLDEGLKMTIDWMKQNGDA
jgi:nucleoside-diphosphate-sugar epimerase